MISHLAVAGSAGDRALSSIARKTRLWSSSDRTSLGNRDSLATSYVQTSAHSSRRYFEERPIPKTRTIADTEKEVASKRCPSAARDAAADSTPTPMEK